MDMLAFLQDSTDDDSEDDNVSASKTAKAKKTIHTSAVTTYGRNKKNARRGCIDIISSSKAKDSQIFSRSVPHRRGHWAGHVKIPILTNSSFSSDLQRRKVEAVKTFRNLLEIEGISGTMVEHECLHLSLSKQFSLQAAQIESFVRQLTNLVGQEHATSLYIDAISASDMRTIWDNGNIDEMLLLNDEKSRSFLCWEVRQNVTLQRIVAHIDTVMKSYNQPVYYHPAKFHISIASFPGNIIEKFHCVNNDRNNKTLSDDREVSQSPTSSQSVYALSVPERTAKSTSDAHDEAEDDESLSSESSISVSFLVSVRELKCTIGTTKEYRIPLRESAGIRFDG